MPHPPSLLNRFILHPLQAVAVAAGYALFSLLPLDLASALGGWLGQTLGPRLAVSERAVKNLKRTFPEIEQTELTAIITGMWDNLGRTVAEYVHLGRLDTCGSPDRFEFIGDEYVEQLREDGKPGILFSGHFANWEILPLSMSQRGLPSDLVYRAANNRFLEWLYTYRRSAAKGTLIPKGARGARQLLQAVKDGKHLGILVDQKMNDGIPVPFLGRDAMTAPAIAELALRFDCPVAPCRVERLEGARFRISVLPPMEIERSGDHQVDVFAFMTKVNACIEDWVRDRPEQWLWLHNRWSD